MPTKKNTLVDNAAAAQADQADAEPLPMPTTGGCWIRQPDGSLVRDPAEHPDAPADEPQA